MHRSDDNAKLSNGATLDLAYQNYTTYARARVSYEVSPGVRPFVEATTDTRTHDQYVDPAGIARNPNGATSSIGSTYELTRVLTGEASVGYGQRTYDDPSLAKLRGPVANASLVWSASPLTTVTLKAISGLAETAVNNASGATNRIVLFDVSHALLRNPTIGAGLLYKDTTYTVNDRFAGIVPHEKTLSETLRVDYLTRSAVVRGSFTHERLASSAGLRLYGERLPAGPQAAALTAHQRLAESLHAPPRRPPLSTGTTAGVRASRQFSSVPP